MKARFNLTCLGGLVVLVLPGAVIGQMVQTGGTADSPAIAASGKGIARVAPARAILFISITSERAEFGSDLMTSLTARRDGVLASLAAAGVTTADITPWGLATGSLNGMGMGGMGGAAQSATEGLRILVDDPERVPFVADAALAGGAAGVSGVVYEPGPEPEARSRAAAEAMGSARVEAEAVAEAAGGRLGRLISVTVTPDYSGMYGTSAFAAGGMRGGELMVQDTAINVFLQASWEFVPS